MAVRFSRKKKCFDCPTDQPITAAVAPRPATQTFVAITSEGEQAKLWKHVLYGTATCIQMIEGYAANMLVGDPREALIKLRDRLDVLITKYEVPNGSAKLPGPEERHPQPSQGDRPLGELVFGDVA